MSALKIGVIVGSLSKASINRKLAEALKGLAPDGVSFEDISIDLPLYSADYDADYPPAGKALKAAVEGADAILIVTPEYNRSIPGGLKNALDWASRPWGNRSSLASATPKIGTAKGTRRASVAQ
ncbi:NADPH-dependent FMN reductase [uncultured Brevundimonas sp.]|uniref:NADPH-dependent FMN reductase n=1 Tax=uncultured Brevundimonas sp. TaxID=213418 RepID=UPI002621EC87|nr:NADPH-dependent FMN reductase [uncultured Brevundimonas sp.]